jgi:O-succinylbenzoic acid--CoA ligase
MGGRGVSRPQLLVAQSDRGALAAEVQRAWSQQRTVAIAAPEEAALLEQALPQHSDPAWGAAVVLGTGGSSGARRWCLQPLTHLQLAAEATGTWLRDLGLDPARLELFNPLPLQHVSGLMPLVRAHRWGAALRWLEPEWMRDPARLPKPAVTAVLSLVPTQLQRLLEDPLGQRWLAEFELIWVGGAALPEAAAQQCRQLGLRLSPCYGSTETAAMLAALPPQQFLDGVQGCGQPFPHAELRLSPETGALQVKAASLAEGCLVDGQLQPLALSEGWWTSSDRALLAPEGLLLQGRLDGAISSGGETVFPEQVELRLLQLSRTAGLPLAELLLLPEPDPLWGEILVALLKPAEASLAEADQLLQLVERLAQGLPPSQRPRRWLLCPELERTTLGKWQRSRWRNWLKGVECRPLGRKPQANG